MMIRSINRTEFFELREKLPLVDVRSELEYETGHIPNAINIPILNNEERASVGSTYKHDGKKAAIRKGFELVGPRLTNIIDRADQAAKEGELLVHCWRGGMRSSNFCQFVGMSGINTWSLQGGYKSYRRWAYETFKQPLKLILLSGCTGSGKSEVLRALRAAGEQVIDLEDLANHKGSAFGGLMMPPQPTTEQFENLLFEELLKMNFEQPIWVEDESIAVGKIFLPSDFWRRMRQSPVVMLNVNKEVRVNRLVNDYGGSDKQQFLEAMVKITKKLGGQHFKAAKEKLENDEMGEVMQILLTYYDKAYTSSMDKRKPEKIGDIGWDGKDPREAAARLLRLSNLQTTN